METINNLPSEHKQKIFKALFALLVVLTIFFAVRIMIDLWSYNNPASKEVNTITLSGHGEVQAVPDIADVSFTIQASQPTQAAASDQVNTKTKNILEFLKSSGIADNDVQTQNYSSYPTYSNIVPCFVNSPIPCVREQKIIGYTVSQSIDVKIRKVDDASKIIDGINKIGVTDMSGPNLTIDKPEVLQSQARQKAIDDAQAKAKELAKELGVGLGHITSFNESGNNPMPIYFDKAMSAGATPASVPSQIPKGQNTISSDVTITYEIR